MAKATATRTVTQSMAATMIADPTVTPGPVDPPVISPAPRSTPTGMIRVYIQLPPHIYEDYSLQAEAQSKDPETLLAERLVRCLNHHGPGMWFSAEDKKRLESFLGHMISDPAGAIQRLEPLRGIDVSGVRIELPATTLKRLSTRVRRGQALGDLIREQVVKALRQFVGELPY